MSNETITDLSHTIVAKSDQLNSDDLIGGPATITITAVRVGTSREQPVSIAYEGDENKPYKPCLTMRRLMVAAWGVDPSGWAGRRMTVFRDPVVRYGGDEVGGIRISHLSHIEKPLRIALTMTRGKKAPYVAHPLEDDRVTLDFVLQIVAKVKGENGKKKAEDLIEHLAFEEQVTATDALAARILQLQAKGQAPDPSVTNPMEST